MEKQKAKKSDLKGFLESRHREKNEKTTMRQSLGTLLDKALKDAYDAKRRSS